MLHSATRGHFSSTLVLFFPDSPHESYLKGFNVARDLEWAGGAIHAMKMIFFQLIYHRKFNYFTFIIHSKSTLLMLFISELKQKKSYNTK